MAIPVDHKLHDSTPVAVVLMSCKSSIVIEHTVAVVDKVVDQTLSSTEQLVFVHLRLSARAKKQDKIRALGLMSIVEGFCNEEKKGDNKNRHNK